MKEKNKNILIIFFALSLLLIVLGIVLTILNNNTNKEKVLYYHCESAHIKEKQTGSCDYSLNYDFVYEDNKITDYSNYFKLIFSDKEKYDNFEGITPDNKESIIEKSKQDDNTLTKYYFYSYTEKINNPNIDEYINEIEKEHKLKCTKTEYDKLEIFDAKKKD